MSTARECPYCGQRSEDGHLCHKCTRATKKALRRIADLWPILQETITRRDRLTPAAEIRAETIYGPIPFKAQASEVASKVRARLVPWVKICVEDYGAEFPPDRVGSFCGLLSAYSGRLRTHAESEAWADEVASSRDEIAGAVDLPADRAKVPTGPCPEHTADDEPCAGVIFAIYPAVEELSPHMDCVSPTPGVVVCGKSWPAKDWAHLGSRILARQAQIAEQKSRGRQPDQAAAQYIEPAEWMGARVFLSVADASVVYGIPLRKLYRWLAAGRIRTYEVPAAVLSKARVRVVLPEDVRWVKVEEEVREADVATRRANLLRRAQMVEG